MPDFISAGQEGVFAMSGISSDDDKDTKSIFSLFDARELQTKPYMPRMGRSWVSQKAASESRHLVGL